MLPRTDLKERTKVDALLDWNGNTFRPILTSALRKIIFAPKLGAPEPTIEERKFEIDRVYQLYNEMDNTLEKHSFLANNNLSIGDVQIYNELQNIIYY